MNQAETMIILLLIVIAYFLYQIARQLSYLTGIKIKLPFAQWKIPKRTVQSEPKSKQQKKEKLLN
jgi:hypothetical protein